MFVNQGDLRRSNAGILELEGRALLATEDDDILAFDTDGAGSCSRSVMSGRGFKVNGIGNSINFKLLLGLRNEGGLTSLHGLHGILNLEDMPIGAGGGLDKSLELEFRMDGAYLNTAMS